MLKKILINLLLNKFKNIFYVLLKSKYSYLWPKNISFIIQKNIPLGKKGQKIELFIDQIITPNVIKDGCWDIFIINFIKKFSKKKTVYTIIDIGANIGLISRQIINSGIKIRFVFCFEPEINNFLLLRKNINFFKKIFFFNVGLGKVNKNNAKLYLDTFNKGNYSFINKNKKKQYSISKILNANHTLKKIILNKKINNIIYKSDTQGYDLEIFLSLDVDILKKIKIISIEISNFKFNKNDFLNKILDFKIIYDEYGQKLNKNLLINKLEQKKEFNLLASRE
jgi:FkbM family methyltransferase